jgi:hypothetical protein
VSHWIIGADASNGVHNYSALKQRKDGTYQRRKDFSLPSVRAAVEVGTLGLDKETSFDYWHWYDMLYTAGDTALEHARGGVKPVSGRSRYGGEAQLFMIAVALHELGVKNGDTVDLCILAPPGDAQKADGEPTAGDKYRAGFDRFGNKLDIAKGDEKPRTFHIKNVIVFPETVAAGFAAQYDDAGVFQHKNPMTNSIMLLDGGRVTLDRLIFRNGNVDRTTIATATNDRLGIGLNILRPAARWIRDNLPSVYHDGAEELADRAIRNPGTNSDGLPVYRVHRLGEPPRNISTPILQFIADYHNSVRAFLDAERLASPVQRVMLVGGIEPLIGDRLREDFGGVLQFVSMSDYDHLKNVSASYLNSVGALRYALKKAQPA